MKLKYIVFTIEILKQACKLPLLNAAMVFITKFLQSNYLKAWNHQGTNICITLPDTAVGWIDKKGLVKGNWLAFVFYSYCFKVRLD